jgi:hypothetical protein
VVPSAEARTARDQGSDSPRPGTGAWAPYLTVRTCVGAAKVAGGASIARDPVGEERS